MARFHRARSGRVEPCGATVRSCPLGEENHFDNPRDAGASLTHEALGVTVVQAQARTLISRENTLYGASRSESIPVPVAHRRVAAVQDVYFQEGAVESGNGVRVTRFRNGDAYVRLPLTYQVQEGELQNVTLRIKQGGSVRTAYEKFLEGVEHLPPDAYRLIGTEGGQEVVTTLSTEHYARMRAALRASEDLVSAPVPPAATTQNQTLLGELKRKEDNDD